MAQVARAPALGAGGSRFKSGCPDTKFIMVYDFYKYSALGNDYIVINPETGTFKPTPKNIRLICDRNLGIGADGVLYGPFFDKDKIKLNIFNPDGNEAEKSGNGVRIFAKYLCESGHPRPKKFSLATLGGDVMVEMCENNIITADMGKPDFLSENIPVNGPKRDVIDEVLILDSKSYKMTCVSVGNPHCVLFVDEPSKQMAMDMGPIVETHKLFPKGVNVQFAKIIDKQNVQIEIWERGAGYTLSSGSSSCAVFSAANKLGLVGNKASVFMPGGKLDVELRDDNHIYLSGPVVGICKGEFLGDLRRLME
jgi:diaminopimelate epimerase